MTLWAYDIETESWEHFVCGVAVSDAGDIRVFRSDQESADWYRSLPPTDEVIAHYGGSFDFLQLIAATPDLSWNATLAGSAIVTCQAKGHARCRDTFRLFPLSLAKWTGRKTEIGLACECGQDCGGYCAIRRDMSPGDMQKLIDYNVNDSQILLDTWREDVGRLDACGLSVYGRRGVRNTIGAVAWNTAAEMAGLDPAAPIEWGDYDAGRRAYYGGRTEVGRTHAPLVYRYDVHAMYPWCLTKPVPCGERRTLLGAAARRSFARGDLGIYHARVYVPPTDLPPLPHRYQGETQGRLYNDRLLWTTGHLVGWWSAVELAHAAAHGARIEMIDQAEVWSDEEAIFRPYVEHIYGERRKAIDSGDARWGAILKWFANSLTGKLAQRPEFSRVIVIGADDDPDEGWVQHGGPDSRVYSIAARKVPASGHTWAAATLTARARVALHERLARHSGRWAYCDTDSTYLLDRDERDVHASRLGTWGYEGVGRDWLALAPKLYRYRDETGAPHVRARGVPRATWGALDTMRAGGSVTVEGGVHRLRTSGGAFRARTVTRSWRDAGGERCGTRHVRADGVTVPLHRTRDGEYVDGRAVT